MCGPTGASGGSVICTSNSTWQCGTPTGGPNWILEHGFHGVRGQGVRFTFSPRAADEVLDRLLELNKERYEAEVAAGLHESDQDDEGSQVEPCVPGVVAGRRRMTEPSDASTAVPSPWDLRADLVARITADLLGPLDGEEEVIRGYQMRDGRWSSPGRVRDRYLVGMLAPKGTIAVDPERDDDVGPEEGDEAGSGGVQDGRSPRLVLAQSSMGLSVVVDASVGGLVARCRWGQYRREFEDMDDGSRAVGVGPRALPGGCRGSVGGRRVRPAGGQRRRDRASGSGDPLSRRGRGW